MLELKPRILLTHPSVFVFGGAERQIVEEANWLTDHDYAVTVMTTRAVPEFRNALKEARLVETGSLTELQELTRRYVHKFQIYHPHNHPCQLLLHPKKWLTVWQHNEAREEVLRGGSLNPEEVTVTNQCVTKTVVISDFEKERYKRTYGVEPIVNYPGIDYSFFSDDCDKSELVTVTRSLGINGNPVLLECGYITWTKNQVRAVEVLAEVKKVYPDAVLVLAGYDKDPYVQTVRKRANELGIEKDIIMTGYIKDDRVIRSLMRLATVHILPTYEQGGWAVAFQSVAAGTPTIVSDRFVGSSLFSRHKLGAVSSLDEFPDTVLSVLSDIERHRAVTVTSRKWIKSNLTWDSFGKRYDKIFTSLWSD